MNVRDVRKKTGKFSIYVCSCSPVRKEVGGGSPTDLAGAKVHWEGGPV